MASKGNDSPDSGFLVETVPSEEDTASLVSGGTSIGSATLDFPDGIAFQDLVDLQGDGVCRVLMKGDRGKPPRVCGCPAKLCRRPNHSKKRLKETDVACKGWYVRYGSKNGYPDGRMDLGTYEAPEVETLKLAARARDQADLEAFLPPAEEVEFGQEEEEEVPGGEQGVCEVLDTKPPPVLLKKAPVVVNTGGKGIGSRDHVARRASRTPSHWERDNRSGKSLPVAKRPCYQNYRRLIGRATYPRREPAPVGAKFTLGERRHIPVR